MFKVRLQAPAQASSPLALLGQPLYIVACQEGPLGDEQPCRAVPEAGREAGTETVAVVLCPQLPLLQPQLTGVNGVERRDSQSVMAPFSTNGARCVEGAQATADGRRSWSLRCCRAVCRTATAAASTGAAHRPLGSPCHTLQYQSRCTVRHRAGPARSPTWPRRSRPRTQPRLKCAAGRGRCAPCAASQPPHSPHVCAP
jgi:hypothetical protein